MEKKQKAKITPAEVFIEIRKRLLLPLFIFVGGVSLGIIFNKQILIFILSLLNLNGINVVLTSSYQIFEIAFNIGLFVGLSLSLPVLIYQIYFFVKPALQKKERKLIGFITTLSIILFLLGSTIGIKMSQYVFGFFVSSSSDINIGNFMEVSKVLNQTLSMSLLTGTIFQIPLILTALIKLKILKREVLIRQRKIVWITLLVLAIIMPTTDTLSLMLTFIPLVLLFEFTLLLNR